MERIVSAIRDHMAMEQEHYEWKRARAERLDAQDAELRGTSVAEAYYSWLYNNGLASAISSGVE